MATSKARPRQTMPQPAAATPLPVQRVQLGVRLEVRMVKVLKAIAEDQDRTLGELLEEIVLHAFEGGGANAFNETSLDKIRKLREVYGMDYDVHANHLFREEPSAPVQ